MATKDGDKIDRKQWLIDNKLEDAITVFEKRNVDIEELIDFEKEDLIEFAKDVLHLDVLARNRFIKAINKLKDIRNKNKPNNNNLDFNFNFQPQSFQPNKDSIIISNEEHKAKEQLYERNNEIAKLCYNITTAMDHQLEQSYSNTLIEINNIFDTINQQLISKKQQLMNDIINIEKQKTDTLKKQLLSLNEYMPILNDTKKQYYKHIEDKNLDIKSRKNIVLKLISNALNNNQNVCTFVTKPNIKFNIPSKTVNEFINKLEINNCDQPYPPDIIITKCTASIIAIKWEFKIHKPNSIQIQYAILPKIIDNDEKIEDKKQKNNKNKGKKRSFLSSIIGTNNSNNGEFDSGNQSDIENTTENKSDTQSESETDFSHNSNDDKTSGYSTDTDNDESDYRKQQKRKKRYKQKRKRRKEKHRETNIELTLELPNDIDIDSLKWKSIEKNRKYNYYEIDELNHNRLYAIRIRGSNDNGYGMYSKCVVGKTKKLTFNSKIIKASEQKKLLNMLKKNKNKIRFKGKKNNKMDINLLGWKLLYRASKYNYNWSEFYRKCKGKKNTLVIAVSESNNVFGGYVNIAWQQPPSANWSYGNDANAFLFILRSSKKSDIGVYNIMKQYSQFAICYWDQYGPCFGQNCEISIANACNVSTSNYSQRGTYNGITHDGQLAGTQYFKVTDYEVWQLQQ